ncbi:MAG: thiamine pyrophosphate-binding protein, partial [Paludibacteraceae bacterium]
MKVADQFVKMLEEAGVKHFYAITGDSLNHVNHAIKKSEKLKWIHVRHEETGAYAASAEAQLTGRLACCAGSSGPGHVHLINGLYDANRSYAPVLALASTEVSAMAGTSFFQETEPLKLFEDCSVYNEIANTPEQAFRMMRSAMLAASGKNGVAVVGLPGDVSSQDAFPTEILPIQRIDNETVIPAQPDIDLLA